MTHDQLQAVGEACDSLRPVRAALAANRSPIENRIIDDAVRMLEYAAQFARCRLGVGSAGGEADSLASFRHVAGRWAGDLTGE